MNIRYGNLLFMDELKSIELSNNAMKVLCHRYLLHRNGEMETPEELFTRVAKSVAAAELKWNDKVWTQKKEKDFFEMMSQLLFLPNSPTLMNAGTPLNQLSACFVLPVEDSLNAIFTSLKNAALIQQSGGGTGFNFSHLRPKDDPLTLTNGTASGPVSFMKVFNAATEHIKHGGNRRGANMGILNIDHPDIEEFICVKDDEQSLNNFNISVGVSDTFMEAVESNSSWYLMHPKTKRITKTVKATKLWSRIVENAWQTGDPGMIFLDTINKSNALIKIEKIESTNPCGEVPLLPYEACNLGSINLAQFVRKKTTIDWEKLETVIQNAVRFLDDVVEINNYIIPETKTVVEQNRKVGLGVMGWADLLILLQIPYDSDAALSLAERLMQFIQQKAIEASESLAKERGCFPNWEKSVLYPNKPMRNATVLSIAPTGTISIVADASSSIEPLFALAFERRNILDGNSLPEINKYFLDYVKEYDLYTSEIIELVKREGNLSNVKNIPYEAKRIFRTALEISPEWHLKHQTVFQKYVDNAVSKTINLPQSATVEDVAHIYKTAWEQKAKGITVFRQHSRRQQVLLQGVRDVRPCQVCIS
jgi:ribonucleoside-diphosphate reductase alpha chain